jgi:tetratricopeptide (TPR) repeat protein
MAAGAEETAAHAWRALAIVDANGARYDDARLALRHLAALIERHPNPLLEAGMARGSASIAEEQGQLSEAYAGYRRGLMLAERALGTEHLQIAAIVLDLSGIAYKQGRYAEALELAQCALAMRERQLGPVHPLVYKALDAVAMSLDMLGRREEALAAYQRALAMVRATDPTIARRPSCSTTSASSTVSSIATTKRSP